jgi:hypothetical protein
MVTLSNRGDNMAVLVRMTAPGMDAGTYDQVSAHLTDLIMKQPGFLFHVAYPNPGGFSVSEVWDSEGQFDTWFTENVQPNVPGIEREVVPLHAVLYP